MSNRIEDEHDCSRALVMGAHYADRRDLEGILSFFTDDAVIERMGERFEGIAAIRALLERRLEETDTGRVTCHVLAAPVINLVGPDEAEGGAVFTLYEGVRGTAAGPLPIGLPAAVGEFKQRYRRTESGWKVSFTRNEAIFKRA